MTERVAEAGLPLTERLPLVVPLQRPVDVVLDRIQRHLVGGGGCPERFLALGETLCARMVSLCGDPGVDHGIVDALTGRLAPRRQAASLISHYFERWRVLGLIDHQAPPVGFWLAVSRHEPLSDFDRAAFSRLIALELAGTASMRAAAIRDLVDVLRTLPMQRLVRLGKPVRAPGAIGFFLAGGDRQPGHGRIPVGATPIDMSGLVSCFRQSRPVESAVLAALVGVAGRWRDAPARRSGSRVGQLNTPVRAVVGFHGIRRQLSASDATAGADEIEIVCPAIGMDPAQAGVGPDPVAVRVLDSSLSGCRIELGSQRAEIDDLIGFAWGDAGWRVGRVVWMTRSGIGWECGIHWLVHAIDKARVKLNSGRTAAALVGKRLVDQGSALIVDAPLEAVHDRPILVGVRDGGWTQQCGSDAVAIGPLAYVGVDRPRPSTAPAPVPVPVPEQPPGSRNAAQVDAWDLLGR